MPTRPMPPTRGPTAAQSTAEAATTQPSRQTAPKAAGTALVGRQFELRRPPRHCMTGTSPIASIPRAGP